jgi:hypothetical protein
MSTPYEIDVSLSPDTVTQLKAEGFALYGFKAVSTTIGGAAPLVWFRTLTFLNTTKVKWTEQYQAYISTSAIITNGEIDASTNVDMDLGATANVDASGNLTPVGGGAAGAISINNQSSNHWTCGISQMAGNTANPMCAIPLNGNMLDEVVPIEKVLLTFASNTVDMGTVIYKCFSSGLMVDLTAANTRSVAFDIDKGWQWDGGTWASQVAPNANLVPLLIEN